ncbi:MAG: GAF domain-containing protein, partial [Chloroflexi bacterium]|nr:GAF domain-containing protein [Chloroflexota bacterium]
RGVQRRSVQLQTASEIARDATATLDVDKLLDETVRLVSERFDLYHAGVFLIDERGEYAVLCAASSEGGRRMIEHEHKLAVGKEGIVGHVAGSGEPLVVLDVGKDAAYLINPDLLDTRSEMTLPLTSRGRVIGVLDVQSTQKNAFSEEDVAVLRTMADQLANAIESARLFGETQQQARDLRLLCETGRLLASSLKATDVLGQIAQRCTEVFDADLTLVRLIEDGSLAVRGSHFRDPAEREEVEGLLSAHPIRVGEGIAGRVAATGQPEIHRGEDVSRLTLSGYVAYLRTREWVLVPMRIGETVTGVLTLIRRSEKGPFLERDVALAQGIADQVAIAIENARLYEEARHRLQGLTTLNRASQVITSSLDVKDVLEQIVELAGSVVNSDHTSVILLDEKGKPVLGAGDFLGVPHVAQRIRSRGVTRHVLDSGQTVVVDTISGEGAVSPPLRRLDGGLIGANPDIVAAGIRSFAAVPIQAKGRVMGVLFVHSRQPHAFREQVPLLTTFANQAAVAIENARLFEVEREQRAQAEALREAGIIVSSALDLDEVLERLLEQVERIVPSDSSSVVLVSDGKARIAHQRGYERFGVADAVARLTLEVQETASLRRMVETGQPHIVPDTSADPDWAVLEATVHIRSWAGAPILVGGEVVGFFSLDKIEAGFYQQQHAELLASFTRQAAIAVENARLFEEAKEHVASLQETTRDLELIRQVSQVTSSSLDLTRILETTAEQMVAVFGADHSGILLFDQAQTYGQVMAEYPPTGATGERYPVQGYLAAERIIADREPLVIEDAWSDPLMAAVREAMHKLDIRSMLIVPLIVKGEVVGSIGLDAVGRQRRFSADEVALAQTIANQVAIAIENARLFEQAQRRWQEAETLYRAAQALGTTLDLHQVFERILSELQQVVPYDSASVQLLRGERLEIIGGHGFPNLDELLGISFDYSDGDNPNKEVMRQRAPFIVEDAPAVYPVFREEPHAAAGIHAWLGVPLLFGDRLTGMLALDKREPGFYTCEHAHLASAFAAQAAIAIENARLFEAANQRVAELEAVRQASLHLTSSLELQPVLEAILEHTLRLVSADDAHVFLYDGERLTFGAALWAGDFQQEPYDEPRPHGLTYTVARSGERIVVPDAKDHPLFQDQQWDQWGGAIVGLPLHVGDRVHGVMNVAFAKPHAFSENELRVLELLADQAAIAIENARLYEETRQRAEEMTALHETTLDITAQLEMPRLLNAIIERASALLGATGGLVHLYDPAEGKLVVVTSHNLDKDYTGLTLEVGEGAAGMVLQMEEPLIVEDHHAWADRSPQVADAAARAMLAVPLKWRERVIGVLDIIDEVRAGTFDEQDLRLLMPFANQVAIAIQNARLFEEVRQRARQWEALTEVGQAIGSILDLDEVLQLILEQLEQVIPYDTVSLWLREGEVMRIRAVRGFERAEPHLGLTIALQDDALSWEMVSARRPLVIADAQQDERFRALADTEWVRSWLGVPLLSKGEVIGLVTINKKEPGLYTAETAELALAFGQQAAMAIENARLYEEAKRRAEEMTALYSTFLEIGAPTDLPDLLWAICDRAARLLGVDKGGLYLYDEPRGELELAVSYKLGRDYTGTRIKLGEGVAGRVVQTGQPLTVDDYSRWEERALAYEEESFGAVIAVPLRWQERTIGVITLSEATGRRTFTPDDERLLGLFAQQAAVAIESVRLYEEARRHVEELSALHTIDVAIASTLNLDEVLERVYEQVSAVMNVAAFHIALYDEKKDAFRVPIIVDQGERLPPQTLEGGLSGWVVRTREPLWIGDMEKERDTLPVEAIALGVPTRSLMVLPLIVRDKVVGAMSAQSYEPYAFDEGHRRLFSGIAGQVAIAVQNARLFEETNHRLAETRLLQEVMQAAASTLDFDEVLARTIETLHETLGMDCLAFVLPDEQGT